MKRAKCRKMVVVRVLLGVFLLNQATFGSMAYAGSTSASPSDNQAAPIVLADANVSNTTSTAAAPAAPIVLADANVPGADASNATLQQKVADLEKRLADVEKAQAPVPTSANGPNFPGQPQQTKGPAPFSEDDWTWLNGNDRQQYAALDTKYFTPEFLVDFDYDYEMAHPTDHSVNGSGEFFRHDEFQLDDFEFGGDLHVGNARGRIMTQFGGYSEGIPRNDGSPGRGQWDLTDQFRYLSEAWGGYHWDKMYGINLDGGILMSYVGLFSFYQAENWAAQPSYVSSNTPWFFEGFRLQTFPTPRLKLEYWLINGWQSYGTYNEQPGLGFELQYAPNGKVKFISNNYYGYDTLNDPAQVRLHTDDSVEVKYYDHPESFLDKMAFSVTQDVGCENGGGARCWHGTNTAPDTYMIGGMVYNRWWFSHDHYAITIGGGYITNPGRYLTLLPSVNGATALTGTPYYTENPGDPYYGYDYSITFDYMPDQFILWRAEAGHRHVNVGYFTGAGGVTPPGGNNGSPSVPVPGWAPDLVKDEDHVSLSMVVRM